MLKNLKVRTRLILLVIFTSLAMLLLACLGLLNAWNTRMAIDEVYLGGVNNIYDLSMMRNMFAPKMSSTLIKMRKGAIEWQEAFETIEEAKVKAVEAWDIHKKRPHYLSERLAQQQKDLSEKLDLLLKDSEPSFVKLKEILLSRNQEQLNDYVMNDFYKVVEPILSTIDQLINIHIQQNQIDYDRAVATSKWYEALTIIGVLLALGLSIPFAIAVVNSIVSPLEYAVKNVNEAAEGKTPEVKVISGGELGELLQAMQNTHLSTKRMAAAFSNIASGDLSVAVPLRSDEDDLGIAINHMVAKMRAIIGRIQDEVRTLYSSSQEITASLTQLSSGYVETAAAVTETSTAAEELKQTSRLSVNKANEVLANAEETLQTVKSNEMIISTIIDDMNQIHNKMNVISESIIKLSEKTKTIAQIMDAVNDLAEQSNLLAVNAAIEAAKAGEHGRGFSVVAQEIRALSEQSKSATVQVRSLLNEIENATQAAVVATQQGSQAVEKGVEQSLLTSEGIKVLAKNTTKVSQAANQIALSNQQQLIGVEQVTAAMESIREAANQHVDNLRQIEAAIKALNNVGERLKTLTDQYRLPIH